MTAIPIVVWVGAGAGLAVGAGLVLIAWGVVAWRAGRDWE